jgi:Carboxypeptidase regulatory-like domain
MDKIGWRVTFTLLFTAFTLPVTSQVQNGQITGAVTDPTEAAIVGARVTVRNMDTGYRLNLHTNDAGLFVATELPVGHYQITVEATGFKVAKSSELTLNAGTSLRVDFQLTLSRRPQGIGVGWVIGPSTCRVGQQRNGV